MSCDRVRYDGHEGLGPEVALIRCSISVITGMEDSSNTSQCPVTELDMMGMKHLDQRYCCYCNVCCDPGHRIRCVYEGPEERCVYVDWWERGMSDNLVMLSATQATLS